MACACKKNSTNTVKTVKQVVKKLPTSNNSTSGSTANKRRVIKRISYRRPI